MGHKHLIQTGLAMQRLRYEDTELYNKIAGHVLRMLHVYEAKNLFRVLDLFCPVIEQTIEDKIQLEDEIKSRKMS